MNHGFTVHTMLNCPFAKPTGCKCHVKIVETPTLVMISVSNMHAVEDHAHIVQDKRKRRSIR